MINELGGGANARDDRRRLPNAAKANRCALEIAGGRRLQGDGHMFKATLGELAGDRKQLKSLFEDRQPGDTVLPRNRTAQRLPARQDARAQRHQHG